jgi:hypothetical protein
MATPSPSSAGTGTGTTSATGGQQRKRKRGLTDREKLQQYGVDLPEIPGIPVEIVPLHINAVKIATKFFQKDAKEAAILPYEEPPRSTEISGTEANQQVATASRGSVMESVFNRLGEAASRSQVSPEETRTKAERLSRKTDAIKSWLQAIHRWIRDQRSRERYSNEAGTANNSKDKQTANSARRPVPVAVMEHLLEVTMEHKRVSVRRAATHTIGHLLRKSADCRRWIFEGDNDGGEANQQLIEWMNVIVESYTTLAVNDERKD